MSSSFRSPSKAAPAQGQILATSHKDPPETQLWVRLQHPSGSALSSNLRTSLSADGVRIAQDRAWLSVLYLLVLTRQGRHWSQTCRLGLSPGSATAFPYDLGPAALVSSIPVSHLLENDWVY